MPIYMQFEGIDGDVTAKGHEKWIEVYSAELGVNRKVSNPTGAATNREASVPAVSEIVITKPQDSASPSLFREALSGTGKKVKIDFVHTGTKGPELYLEVELESCMVTSYSVSGNQGSSQDRPRESVALNFTKITYSHTPTTSDNTPGSPNRSSWDLGDQTP